MRIPSWRRLLRKAHAKKYVVLAAILSGFEIVLPIYSDKIPRGVFAGLSFVCAVAAPIAHYTADEAEHASQ